ncbi:MAG: glycosyltransferase [Alicyclobacillaceae bacterium]|nr:glycosyltransferase [Alicyclobacillaceae bacterium]
MSRPFLGVQVIARDEEETLLRCLESVRSVAEEWIVVDTGSRDRTAELARAFGADVLHVPWEEDFAKVRNAGLAHSRAEWVLCLDADEVLNEADPAWLDVLRQSDADGFWLQIDNLIGPGAGDRVHHQALRLFRRRDGIGFSGRIHEDIIPSILRLRGTPKFSSCPWRILHDGYLPDVLKKKNKAQRNLRLLRLSLREHPKNPFYLYNVGITWCQLDRPEKAARWMFRAMKATPPQAPYRPSLCRDLAVVLLSLGQYREVELLLRPELEHYPEYADLHLLFAEALRAQGFWEEAVEAYRKAASCPASHRYVHTAGANRFRPLHAAATLCLELERFDEAEQLERRALAALPGWEAALRGFAEAKMAKGESDADVLIELAALGGKPPNPRSLTRAMAGIGADPIVLDLLRQHPPALSDEEGRLLSIRCLLATGQYAEAYRSLDQWLDVRKNQGQSLLPGRIMELALCRWAEDLPLPQGFYRHVPPSMHAVYDAVDRWMTGEVTRRAEAMANREMSDRRLGRRFVAALIRRAIRLRLLPTAERLAAHPWGPFDLVQAKALYREGFVYEAAYRLLDLLDRRELDAEGLFLLGELLYDKGHSDQAARLFEQSLALRPDFERARAGAAAAALQSARRLLLEAAEQHPHPEVFAEELRALEQAHRLLAGLRWHTRWHGRRRRNRRESAADLPLHDRPQ